ncbi:hypothetical protein AKJ37_00175 [candidate division MSBL1 archaeon SCGC-AAA259I09]|uniref:ABC transporter domain-containing protein n=3 Tax=candidate division MSBL1 TaxID=215777 RepID=A0A133UW47_9EURY|nr:hypothetical protein AKJ61_00405 [candidate division MSBL1 archaeon SCGC-AAA259B11]KXA95038.1 hypothetical protein AKJ36_01690 [candidate division MSBL1 archaeon SCGC-AAA259I07]KXA98412.1 hypothetical protein AKJ37_00175 [candidate division MSBL1 archaeon SCGC-AAA259I09]
MSEKVIKVENLTKEYEDLTAVDDISFEVYRGEVFSLVGPNGAGKTTTVEILECIRTPTSGYAEVFGFDVVKERGKIKEKIGVLPQEFNTFDRLSVSENVELVSSIYGSEKNLEEILRDLELWEFRDKKFEELSGGMKRKVGIAMALSSDPELLFLDEPTTGLDPQARRNLWETIKDLKKTEVTVFLTTHYMEEVEELSDRAAVMLHGKLLSTDSVDRLVSEYGGDVKIVVKNEKNAESVLKRHGDEVFVDDENNVIATFRSRKKAAEAHLKLYEELSEDVDVSVEEPTMDDVFLRVAGGKIDESGALVK